MDNSQTAEYVSHMGTHQITVATNAYDMRDPRAEMEASGRCAAVSVLRGDVELARAFALDYAFARDGIPSLDEAGIRWVLKGDALAKFTTDNAKAAGAWALNNGLCAACFESGHPDGFCVCDDTYCAHNWGHRG